MVHTGLKTLGAPPLFTPRAETLRPGASVLRDFATLLGGAPPPNWRRKEDTSKFSMSRAASRPSPEADTSTWATLRETLLCTPGADISAQAKSEGALNWKRPAATSGGTITAWINPDPPSGGGSVRLAGASQLASGNGDIIVFLPRNLAANIDATVTNGGERRIEADPALHLTMQASTNGSGPVHAMAVLNSGDAPLKLKTPAGKNRLEFLDSEVALHESLIREQMDRLNKRLKENSFAA